METFTHSEDFSFVSLQYDIDYEDFSNFHPNYSVNFLETGFLDQKNDIEELPV